MGNETKFAISVTELEVGEFHYVVLRRVETSILLFAYEPVKRGNRAYNTSHAAWFGGLDAVLKLAAVKPA